VLGADLNAVHGGVVLDQIARPTSQRTDNTRTTDRPLGGGESSGNGDTNTDNNVQLGINSISTVATSMSYAAGTGDAAAMMAMIKDQRRSAELSERLRVEQSKENATKPPNNGMI
jgi:hypothetical protein